MSEFTEGHCPQKAKPEGCQLHNLQCGYPECDRRPVREPIKLVTRLNPDPDPDIVAGLRGLLEMAERGEVKSVAICYENIDSTITTILEARSNRFALSHAIIALWFRFQQKMLEEAE